MPLNWQLWDRIRALARRANIYRSENIYQDQSSLDKLTIGGQIIDFSRQNALLEQTNLQINRLERYKDYDMMDEVGCVHLALDMYADEASLCDPERKHSIIVRAKNLQIKRIVEDFLYNTLMIDREIRPIIRYLCKFGDFGAEIIPTKNRDGVASFRFMNIYHLTRIQTKFGDLIGFFYQDQVTGIPQFMHPWQVMHMRLTSYENNYHPYGRSILEGGRKDFKRLRLMEDAALIYRITRAPEKRIFSIPVGNIPPQQVPQYMELIARQMKKFKFVDPATGQVNERYSPLIQEDDFWLPKRADGTGPSVDTLPGAENLDAIADIEYFKKNMIAGLKIPFSRVGIGEPSESEGKTLAASSPEFAKAIQWVQREVILGLKKLVVAHLAMRGHSISEIKGFDLAMTSASAIDELYRIETWNTRADIIANLNETGLFTPRWILKRFTDMTDEEITELEKEREKGSAVSASPTVAPVAEDVDLDPALATNDEERALLLENQQQEKRFDYGRKLILEIESPVDWLVNQKELDGLCGEGDAVLVRESVDPLEAEEAKNEVLALLRGETAVVPSEINDIARAVEEVQSSEKLIIEASGADAAN